MPVLSEVRSSAIAGTWYEGGAEALAFSVDRYISEARLPELEGEVIAIIAPHAGHHYSGGVAGYAFAAIKDSSPDVVAVLSPMHHLYPFPLLTTAHSAYETPLGEILVNGLLVDSLDVKLKERLRYGLSPVANDPEH